MLGGVALATSIVTSAVALPAVFVAVTVYVSVAVMVVGVPAMTPVAPFILRPAGRLGLTLQLSTVPPPFVGDKLLIATLSAMEITEGEYEMTGAVSDQVIVAFAV